MRKSMLLIALLAIVGLALAAGCTSNNQESSSDNHGGPSEVEGDFDATDNTTNTTTSMGNSTMGNATTSG